MRLDEMRGLYEKIKQEGCVEHDHLTSCHPCTLLFNSIGDMLTILEGISVLTAKYEMVLVDQPMITESGKRALQHEIKKMFDDINQNVYRDNQRQRNINFVEDNLKEVQSFLKTEDGKKIQKVLDSKNLSLEEALQGNSRSKQKVLFTIAQVMASKGNEDAKKVIQQDKKAHEEFVEKSVKAITENSNMREGMLNSIREEFPLKSISDGEETMAIGEYSLDRKTMENIFGTSDYDKIKESLVAVSGNPPFLGYRAKVGDEVIPIAKIGIREDGRGYGGQIKFEMQMDDRFAKKLSEANQQVY